jgi:hypothetical protein
MKRLRYAALCLLLVAVGVACTSKKVDESHVGVRYTDGPIDGKKFEKVVQPGGTEWVYNDHVYMLPTRQVTYIAAGDGAAPGQDGPQAVLTAEGGEILNVDLTVFFFLNTRADVLKQFFNQTCKKYSCWDGVDQSEKTDDGWDHMLRDTFGNPMVTVTNEIGLKYNADQLRYNPEVQEKFGHEFASKFVDTLKDQVGRDDFFCGPGYTRNQEGCPELSVKITRIRFNDPEREALRGKQILADKNVELAKRQAEANLAQARADQNLATPSHLALLAAQAQVTQADAALECAKRPDCRMLVGVGNVTPTVPTN